MSETDVIESGQKKTVQIIDLYIKDTYDEEIYNKLHGKGAMADIVIDNKQGEELSKAMDYISKMGISFSKKSISTENLLNK